MIRLRALIRSKRHFAMFILAITLCVKALLPAGYMLGHASQSLTVQLCTDLSATHQITKIVLPVKNDGGVAEHGKEAGLCGYSALSMASLGGADAPLLAIALAFILALGFKTATALPHVRISYLRPPLRGPPLAA